MWAIFLLIRSFFLFVRVFVKNARMIFNVRNIFLETLKALKCIAL